MSAEATAWAKAQIKRRKLNPSVKRTLLAVAAAHLKGANITRISYDQIADKTQDSRRSAIDAIRELEGLGLLTKCRQRQKQRQGANAYALKMHHSQSEILHPETALSECRIETSEGSAATAPSEIFQSAVAALPNARARTRVGSTTAGAVSLEEMERFVWPNLKIAGGRDA